MNELDQLWAEKIREAAAKARNAGRADVSDYLNLKQNNDELRSTACHWLFDSFVELSDEANRRGIRLDVENANPHTFKVGAATMVGSLISFKRGLRNITIEAGWTRTPQDGFIRGGGLACARITHFGLSKHNAELMLFALKDKLPQWFFVSPEEPKKEIFGADLRRHFGIFLEEI